MKQEDKNRLLESFRNGTISSEDRRKLDLAALDDDLLFDAMEGYYSGQEREGAVDDLRQKLHDRVSKRKSRRIILIPTAVAAMIILGFVAWWLNKDISTLGESPIMADQIEIDKSEEDSFQNDATSSGSELVDNKKINEKTSKIRIEPQVKSKPIFEEEEIPTTTKDELAEIPQPPPAEEEVVIFQGDLNTEYTPVEEYESAVAEENRIKNEGAEMSDDVSVEEDMEVQDYADEEVIITAKENKQAPGARASSSAMKKKSRSANKELAGRIVDENGDPLIGANIIANENYGTTSDFNGKFTMTVPSDIHVLNVKYIGFSDQKITLENTEEDITDLEILMKESAGTLSEVVVTGGAAIPTPEIGENEFWMFVQNNKKIPQQAIANQVSGVVILTFEVNNEGIPVNFKVLNSPGYGLEEEAIRLILASGKWSPTGKRQIEIEF